MGLEKIKYAQGNDAKDLMLDMRKITSVMNDGGYQLTGFDIVPASKNTYLYRGLLVFKPTEQHLKQTVVICDGKKFSELVERISDVTKTMNEDGSSLSIHKVLQEEGSVYHHAILVFSKEVQEEDED